MNDANLTISAPAAGHNTEKGSKFIAHAFHVESPEDVAKLVKQHKKDYFDARHVCYAYVLGALRSSFRAVDDGEPSGTAGKPILNVIHSRQLTDTLVIVVRYFGGTLLGVPGLIRAYKAATEDALGAAQIEERTVQDELRLTFEYALLNAVMKVVKDEAPHIVEQSFELTCSMTLRVRKSSTERLLSKLRLIRGVEIAQE